MPAMPCAFEKVRATMTRGFWRAAGIWVLCAGSVT